MENFKRTIRDLFFKYAKSNISMIIGIFISILGLIIVMKFSFDYTIHPSIEFNHTLPDFITLIIIGIILFGLCVVVIINTIQCRVLILQSERAEEKLNSTQISLVVVCELLSNIQEKIEYITETQDDFVDNVVDMYRDIKAMQIDNIKEIRELGGDE